MQTRMSPTKRARTVRFFWSGIRLSLIRLQGNRFDVLETESTAPTLDIDETSSGSNFKAPCAPAYPGLPQSREETDAAIYKKDQVDHTLCPDLFAVSIPLLLSKPSSPRPIPIVRMPHRNQCFPIPAQFAGYGPHNLNNVEIPSPLLYHDLPYEFVPATNNVQQGYDLPCFEYAGGQCQPDPAFASNGHTIAVVDKRPPMGNRQESLGFTDCVPDSSKHRAEDSCISDEGHVTSTHQYPCREPSNQGDISLTLQRPTNPLHRFSEDQFNIPVDPEWSWAKDLLHLRAQRRHETDLPYSFWGADDSLVYPTLPTPAYLTQAVGSSCSMNNVVQPWANHSGDLWEQSTPDPAQFALPEPQFLSCQPAEDFSPRKFLLRSTSSGTVVHNVGDDASFNVNAGGILYNGPPLCTDLVPARFDDQQLAPWPPVTQALIPAAPSVTYPRCGPCCDCAENVIKLHDWLVSLSPTTAGPGESQNDPSSLSEQPTENVERKYCESHCELNSEPDSCGRISSEGGVRLDAGTMERTNAFDAASIFKTETELLIESGTDEEWAYWDWATDFEDARMADAGPGNMTA